MKNRHRCNLVCTLSISDARLMYSLEAISFLMVSQSEVAMLIKSKKTYIEDELIEGTFSPQQQHGWVNFIIIINYLKEDGEEGKLEGEMAEFIKDMDKSNDKKVSSKYLDEISPIKNQQAIRQFTSRRHILS